jgi:hypothetical protein
MFVECVCIYVLMDGNNEWCVSVGKERTNRINNPALKDYV